MRATQRNPTAATDDLAGVRHALIDNGYTPVPVEGKSPQGTRGWQRLKPDHKQVDGLIRHAPGAKNTGILTGDVVAIDVDVPDVDTASRLGAMARALPGGERALCRIGKAPKALYVFRTDTPRGKCVTGKYWVAGSVCQIEVLGKGQQFVAFGIHPDTGAPYDWHGASPIEIPFADLPAIDASTVDAFIVAAEAVLAAAGEPIKKTAATAPKPVGGTFWRAVNAAELHALDRWVPALFPTARRESGTGAWRVSSADLGRALEEDLSIHPNGIQDFGREKPETPINLVMDFGGAPTTKDAAFWLCERLGADPGELGWQQRGLGVTVTYGTAPAPVAANDDDPSAELSTIEDAPIEGLPVHHCYPPGAVGDFARFIVDAARFPSPPLALAGALALTAALVGRRYKGPTGLRSNIYLVGLADSGHGKDITLRAPVAIAGSTQAGERVVDKFFIDDLASVQGLATRLRKDPAGVLQIDEFGKWLGAITSRKAPPHKEAIASAVLQLTGAATGSWGGAEKAAGNLARVHHPCVSIHGVSTPGTFWAALSGGNISEGLLGRLVVIDAGNLPPKKVRRPSASTDDVPAALAAHVEALIGGSIGGNLFGLTINGEQRPQAIIAAQYAQGVEDLFEGFDDRMRAEAFRTDPQLRPLLTRVGENAARLALIVAVGCDPAEPIITAEIQRWANDVAEASYRTIAAGAADNVADNDRQMEYLRIRSFITRKGADGIAHKFVVKHARGRLEKRQLDDMLELMAQAGEVVFGETLADSGQKLRRWWGAEHRPEVLKAMPMPG